MEPQKISEVLHDLKRIAVIIGEWEEADHVFRTRFIKCFDKLYKDLENELLGGDKDRV